MDKSGLKMAFGWLKQRRGRMKGISEAAEGVCFGRYALQALEPAWLTAKQIEAGRRAITRNVHRGGGKVWARTFAHKTVTGKPAETRMGRGKGGVKYSVAVVQPGKILYEMGGVAENIARKAVLVAASKMPIRTRFIVDSRKLFDFICGLKITLFEKKWMNLNFNFKKFIFACRVWVVLFPSPVKSLILYCRMLDLSCVGKS